MKKIKIKEILGGITASTGFLASGTNCGIRKIKPDIALIFSKEKCQAVASFTKNQFQAAPILVSKKHLNNPISAIIVNSGNANAATGKQGISDADEMCKITADYLNVKKENILVSSTGVIGKRLDLEKIRKGIKMLIPILSKKGHTDAASAILTTDKRVKEVAVQFKINRKTVRIGAMAKGSGMINPSMATMLAFISSDVNIERKLLKRIFQHAVDNSFNLITVDGDMSTNDSVIFLANGMTGNTLIDNSKPEYVKIFYANLLYVMKKLARMIVQDGEGVTKLIEVEVRNSLTFKEAKKIASSISKSLLVKTAVYGQDPNWGRVVAALGACGVKLPIEKISIKFGNTTVFKNNEPVKFNEKKVKDYLKNDEVKIIVDIQKGDKSVTFLSGDLTEEYVRINAHYRT